MKSSMKTPWNQLTISNGVITRNERAPGGGKRVRSPVSPSAVAICCRHTEFRAHWLTPRLAIDVIVIDFAAAFVRQIGSCVAFALVTLPATCLPSVDKMLSKLTHSIDLLAIIDYVPVCRLLCGLILTTSPTSPTSIKSHAVSPLATSLIEDAMQFKMISTLIGFTGSDRVRLAIH